MINNSAVEIDYVNYRGQRSGRVVFPIGIRWGATEYHPEPQWLLEAFDVDKDAMRTFAMRDIHGWLSRPDVERPGVDLPAAIDEVRAAGADAWDYVEDSAASLWRDETPPGE